MEVRLFGGIEVSFDDAPGVRIAAAKTRWLLAFLAFGVGRSRSVDSIIDALWGEHPPASATNLVQGYVSDLRKIVGREHIQTTENGYSLAIDDDAVDVVRFHDIVERARAEAATGQRHALALLDTALALGAGMPFGEVAPDGPLAAAAARLIEQRVDAEELRAQLLLDVGDHPSAVNALHELVDRHPYREGLWATLAIALYRSDRQVDALRCLAEARRVLADDLGVSPGPRLIEIEQQVLNHNPELSAATGASAARATPPLAPSIVGRSAELTRLHDRLTHVGDSAQHTIFVGGEPGIGKTTVARELARTSADDGTLVLVGRCDERVAVPYRPFIEALTDHVRSIGDDAAEVLLRQRWEMATAVVPSVSATPTADTGADITLLERFDTFCWMLQQIQGDRRMPHDSPGSDNEEIAGWVYRETDGNPFLAVEIIDHITATGSRDGVPVGVTEVVERRLRRLSAETQRLLEYAAVLGEAAPVALLRQFADVLSDVPSALAEATQAGILSDVDHGERQYRFTHAIIRKAATASMSSLQLEDLHMAAAGAWASQPRSDGVTVAVASHFLAAGAAAGLDEAVDAFTRAGDESDRTGAKVEAVTWYDRALSRLPDDDQRRPPLRLQRFVAAQAAWHWLHGDYGHPNAV